MDKKSKTNKQLDKTDIDKLLKFETLDPKSAKPEDNRTAFFMMETVEKIGKQYEGAEIYKGTASSNVVDRDEEVMLPMGMKAENFLKNPVILKAHNYRENAVGKALGLMVNEDNVDFEFIFAKTKDAQELEGLYSDGFMRGFSITFTPIKRLWVNDETPEKFMVEVAGRNITIDLAKYERKPRLLTLEWELLEISCVSVPANQNALMHGVKALGMKTLDGISNPVQKGLAKESIDQYIEQLGSLLESIGNAPTECKTVVPFLSTPIDMEMAWSASDARAKAAMFASSDGSGDKDKIDWAKFSKFFTRYDEAKADQLTSYHLQHHTVKDGKMVAVWKGVVAAMAALFGARGAKPYSSEDEKKKIYDHLVKHYKDADKEPPEYKSYTEDELKKMFPEEIVTSKGGEPDGQGTPEGDPQPVQPNDIKEIKESISEILSKLASMDEAVKTQNVHLSFIKEYMGNQVKGESEPRGDQGDDNPEGVTETLKSFLDTMKKTGNPPKKTE